MVEKKKYWYHYTAIAMLILFNFGTLTVSDLPTYYCDLEDSVKPCMFLKDNNQTCVYPFNGEGGVMESAGDRCQKGYTRGTWKFLDNYVRLPVDPNSLDSESTFDIQRPIIMTDAEVLRDLDGRKYVEGHCTSTVIIE